MEKRISSILKYTVDKFFCYRAQNQHSPEFDIQGLLNETISELQSELSPTPDDAQIQKIPLFTPKRQPLTEKDFKITNLDTGEALDIRDENHEDFLREFSEITSTNDFSETLGVYFTQKQKMNKALWEAIANNQPEICKLLLSRRNYGDLVAQTNARSLNDETALHMAAKLGNLRICEILLEHGEMTDVNAKDTEERTPLHLACQNDHYLIAQFLIRSGTLINSVDSLLNTPMHYAAMCGSSKLIKYIFTKFGDSHLANAEGLTPLDILKAKNLEVESTGAVESVSINRHSIDRGSETVVLEFEEEEKERVNFMDFEAIQILGRGSFGEVFLVKMKSTGQQYAMKVLKKDQIMGQNLVKYAMVERNVLSYLHHPFIVGLNYAFQSPERLYLVLDYCAGGNLTGYIIRQRFFSESTARFYLSEIILALEEIHRHQIIYRDLKPDNIVIDSQGHALLTDFGLSKEGVQDNSSARSFCGSVAYLAPEMIRRKGHGKSVDWYLLGVLFYEMLNGIPPFYSNSKDQLFYNIQNTKPVIPERISPDAKDLLKRLLKKNPEKRLGAIQGASEVKSHRFFAEVDWEKVLEKRVQPPIKPIVMLVPGYIPKAQFMEDISLEADNRHLSGWTFISDQT